MLRPLRTRERGCCGSGLSWEPKLNSCSGLEDVPGIGVKQVVRQAVLGHLKFFGATWRMLRIGQQSPRIAYFFICFFPYWAILGRTAWFFAIFSDTTVLQ